MKKEIREVDKEKGIVQVTIADERWYFKPTKSANGNPDYTAVPSVTWIASHYPKGIAFYKWLADKGWDEAESLKSAAGQRGSKVHQAIAAIIDGNEVRIDSKFKNPATDQEEELTLEEVDAIMSFVAWRNEVKPVTIAREVVVFSEKYGYAGTVDYICKIDDTFWLIDFKTSQQIWPEYELQVSAYRQTIENGENHFDGLNAANLKVAILQVGYRRNKNGYKWNEVDNKFNLFLAAKTIWKNENDGVEPKKKDYPIVISPSTLPQEVVDKLKSARKTK